MSKKRPGMSEDMMDAFNEVGAASKLLDDRHYLWILDAAIEHFVEELRKTEDEMVRIRTLYAAGTAVRIGRGLVTENRDERDRSLVLRRREYHAILTFLESMKKGAMVASAEQFTADLLASGFFSRKR